jgi:hypothetical protein
VEVWPQLRRSNAGSAEAAAAADGSSGQPARMQLADRYRYANAGTNRW